jgi:uncharacterized protein YtpQ (UPF0354 family)
MKKSTIEKLNSLLKYYLVKTFETHGYNPEDKMVNITRSKRAKMIIITIDKIIQDEEIEKEKLDNLVDMYKTYHTSNGGLWKI